MLSGLRQVLIVGNNYLEADFEDIVDLAGIELPGHSNKGEQFLAQGYVIQALLSLPLNQSMASSKASLA